jgi:hypothetical protein
MAMNQRDGGGSHGADGGSANSAADLRPSRQGRARVWVLTVVSMFAAGLAVLFANVLAQQAGRRWDVSASGDQSLSPRTLQVLGLLKQPYKIVVAADRASLDPRARQAADDVLAEFVHTTPMLQRVQIDTGSVAGQAEYASLIQGLAQRDQGVLQAQGGAISAAADEADKLAAWMTESLSPDLLRVREVSPGGGPVNESNRSYLQSTAAGVRILARDLVNAGVNARAALKADVSGVPVPDTARGAKLLVDALTPAVEQLGTLAKELKRYAGKEGAGEPGERAKLIVPGIEKWRDTSAVTLDSLKRLKRPDLSRINDVLRLGQAALVIGPPEVGINAMDLQTLFSARTVDGAGSGNDAVVDLRKRSEDLIATSLALLLSPQRPIVVIVQASGRRLFDISPIPYFEHLAQRTSERGIDLIEWACAIDPAPPRLAELNPLNARPVVYVTLSPDSSSEGDKSGAGAGPGGKLSGVQQAAKLGEVLRILADQGANLLVNLNPSVLPTYNEVDPIADILGRWGLAADTGRPLMSEQMTTKGRTVTMDYALLPQLTPTSPNPIPSAISGLPTVFQWAVPILRKYDPVLRIKDTVDLYTVPASDLTWAESQWLRVWQTPPEQRAYLQELPKFESGRDLQRPPSTGVVPMDRWSVAAAAEKQDTSGRTQRLVVVGSNSWFTDGITQQRQEVAGRSVSLYPGNAELFESAVMWLAGRDELIAQSPMAKQVSLIGPIESSKLFWIRAAAILGLPAMILALGGLVRLVRG